MVPGISLANKCQLLFGFAIVVILTGALAAPWARSSTLVRESQLEAARQLSETLLRNPAQLALLVETGAESAASAEPLEGPGGPDAGPNAEAQLLRISLISVDEIPAPDADPFLAAALARFRDNPERTEHMATVQTDEGPLYRYARPIRASQMRAIENGSESPKADDPSSADGAADAPPLADPLSALLVIDRSARFAVGQLLTSRVFIIAAGIVATLMAVLLFHLILTKLILSPVRSLRETTEKVQAGELRIRAQIVTGDEFQQLSEAFNSMLERLEQGQAQLRAINENLDLKVNELAQANVGLFESNRFKSEFVANVSHELRTPLNSIIGFAELLQEIAQADGEAADPKRMRYITNILSSGRSLLEMINELLDMAKIESGRMEVNVEPTSVGDLIEGLVAIMRPQAESKRIVLRTVIGQRLPVIETDAGKLQQILYNFMSNAIKFTPEGGAVTISADRVTRQDNAMGVRLAVADSGPGIPYDMQDVIFEKFRQIDASHTRLHAGTGLGLAICRELAELLGATVSFVSEPGRGATFFVDLPLTHQARAPQPLMAG